MSCAQRLAPVCQPWPWRNLCVCGTGQWHPVEHCVGTTDDRSGNSWKKVQICAQKCQPLKHPFTSELRNNQIYKQAAKSFSLSLIHTCISGECHTHLVVDKASNGLHLQQVGGMHLELHQMTVSSFVMPKKGCICSHCCLSTVGIPTYFDLVASPYFGLETWHRIQK